MASKYDSKYDQNVSVMKVHLVYKAIWIPTIGGKLSVQSKDNNKHSIAVIKDSLLRSLLSYLDGL